MKKYYEQFKKWRKGRQEKRREVITQYLDQLFLNMTNECDALWDKFEKTKDESYYEQYMQMYRRISGLYYQSYFILGYRG